jgi:hypothetical protein
MRLIASVIPKYNGVLFEAVKLAIPDAVAEGLSDGGEILRMNAMSNILNGGHGLTGQLADSIQYEPGEKDGDTITGYVKTGALPQASTLEFGTGIFAENGSGSAPWFVHKDMAPDLGIYFPLYKRVDPATGLTKVTDFFRIEGTRPHPYLRPAALAKKDEVNEAVRNAVGKELRSILK